MTQQPQDSFLLFLIFVPAYLALAARSLEYQIAKNKIEVKTVEVFLAKLFFPLNLIFNSKRWYNYIFTVQIDPDIYFPNLYLRIERIQRGRLYWLVILVFVAFAALLVVIRQIHSAKVQIALIALVCHVAAIWLSWTFGSKLNRSMSSEI